MLGLPILSAQAGFQPSLFIFAICWLFMISTGLLLVEVHSWFGKETSLVTMAKTTLGFPGQLMSWLVYLFLFYSFMVAYLAASGSLIADFFGEFSSVSFPHWVGNLFFCFLFALLLFFGTGVVDWCNRLLMLALMIAYLLLVVNGASHVNSSFLAHKHWNAVTAAIPAAIVSFGFHNLIPSLSNYFHGRVKPLVLSIVIGSAIPLLVYIVWQWIILGIVPPQEFAQAINKGEIATEALREAVGASWIVDIAQFFALFAIITSLLGVSLSFVDFLADGLRIQKNVRGRIILILLVLVPPLLFAGIYPSIFLTALNAAGGFGAVILFGILPVLMVWKGRYVQNRNASPLLFGGRPLLLLLFFFSVWVILLQFI